MIIMSTDHDNRQQYVHDCLTWLYSYSELVPKNVPCCVCFDIGRCKGHLVTFGWVIRPWG